MSAATLDHTDSMLADAYRCSECGDFTYDDASGFEVPKFCCRCGEEFVVVDMENDSNASNDT
jgi:hypothetical protein